jgi:hypothetical protein
VRRYDIELSLAKYLGRHAYANANATWRVALAATDGVVFAAATALFKASTHTHAAGVAECLANARAVR